jgi:hypothetical protein
MLKLERALGTPQTKVSPMKRIGHTAGGDAKGLHHKGTEHKGQDKGCDQPFKGIGDFGGPVFPGRVFGLLCSVLGVSFAVWHHDLPDTSFFRLHIVHIKTAYYACKPRSGQ